MGNVDYMCMGQETFKKIAKLLGIPESLMQYGNFVEELAKVVKSSCSKSKNPEILKMYERYKAEYFFCCISNYYMGLASLIAEEIKTNYSTYYSRDAYSRWMNHTDNTKSFDDCRSISVDEKGRVLIQKFTSSASSKSAIPFLDNSNRSAIHLAYSIDRDGNLREDKFVEDSKGKTYIITRSDIRDNPVSSTNTTFDYMGFSNAVTKTVYGDNTDYYGGKKPKHATTQEDTTETYKPKNQVSFVAYISEFFPEYYSRRFEPDRERRGLTTPNRASNSGGHDDR